MHLDEDGFTGQVTIFEENGTEITFDPDGYDPDVFYPTKQRTLANLVRNLDDSWTFTRRTTAEVFTFDPGGFLISIGSQIGDPDDVLTLEYADSKLDTVTDPAGRTLTFTWDGGHVTEVADNTTPGRSVSFGYDGGDLVEWTDVSGGTWAFTYDSHLLTTMRDPRQEGEIDPPVITNDCDGDDRVISQIDRLERETMFDYDEIPVCQGEVRHLR